jgi:DNA-binding NarL/FixJ family response regulator
MIVDISLPGKNGVELIKELRTQLPGMRVLVHSMHDQQIYAERAVRAGASGYVMKQDDGTELLHAVREVLAGKTYRPPGLLKSPHSPRESASPARPSLLTDRELEVFSLIGKGNDNASIANLLNLSIKTVDAHRERIKRKLRFKTSTALNLFAVRWVEADHSCENVYSTVQRGSDAEGETADTENRRRSSRRESARNQPGVR